MSIPTAGQIVRRYNGPMSGLTATLYPVSLYQRDAIARALHDLSSDHGGPLGDACNDLAGRIRCDGGKPYYPSPATHTHEVRQDDLYDFTDAELGLIRQAVKYAYKKAMI